MAFTATKIKITGTIEIKTGLHIGGDASFSAIGAIDSPVVRDPLTREPVIPGSSLKGKLRALLAREFGVVPEKGVAGFEKEPIKVRNTPTPRGDENIRIEGGMPAIVSSEKHPNPARGRKLHHGLAQCHFFL